MSPSTQPYHTTAIVAHSRSYIVFYGLCMMGISLGTLFPLRLRLWFGLKVFGRFDMHVVRVSWHCCIKGPCRPPEVEAMQYVAKHSDIPIPKLYAIHNHNNQIYIEMEYIQGESLESAWHYLTRDEKDTVMAEFKYAMAKLHALEPPTEDLVSSAFQNPAFDSSRVGNNFFGPINHAEFHTVLRQKLPIEYAEESFSKDLYDVHTNRYRTQFCHSDIAGRNIMVHNGHLAAIIDWAFSGWYPEYWDYTRAHYTSPMGLEAFYEWPIYLSRVLKEYKKELEVERYLWRHLPDPGSEMGCYLRGVHYEMPGSSPSQAWLDARAGQETADLWTLALAK